MRKIEKELVEAVTYFEPFTKGNTCFHRKAGTQYCWELSLHGNVIALFSEKGKNPQVPTYVSLAGWPTKTTKSRLNSLPGVHVYTCRGIHYLNGKEISEYGFFEV